MTTTIKNSPELNSPGKPVAPSQNPENKAGLSPRSNPVCLEVSVAIRSLANEAGGPAQPIREEAKSVIVFDNGAVLRSTLNLPVGQTVILSNPSGREVISRVVGGRNLPNLKGYVEVEFVEPVNDYWGIHKDAAPAPLAAAAQPVTSFAPREIPPPPVPSVPARVAVPAPAQAKPANVSLGVGPKFEDQGEPEIIPAPPAARESRIENVRPGPELVNKDKDASGYNLSAIADSTSLANWLPHSAEPPAEKPANPAKRETSSIISPAPAPSHDFLSKGLMAYEQPSSSSDASEGRTPLIVGVAALVLAGVCGVVYFMRRGPAPVTVAKTVVASAPSSPEPPSANSSPEALPAQSPQGDTAQAAGQTQAQAQSVSVEQSQPAAAAATVPAVVTGPANLDLRTDSRLDARADSRSVRRQEKSANAIKPPEPSTPRQPVIASLKMGAPNTPNQTHTDPGEGATPVAEIVAADAAGGTPPAGLLTSAGRISKPPSPPPGIPASTAPAVVSAPRIVREPKLISSARPEYPSAAKQSNIQGTVTVSVSIDENGKVVSAKALNGPLLLRGAAENSVRQWKYSPGSIDGKPAPSKTTVGVEFRLN